MNQSIKQALIDGKHTSPDGTYVQIGMDALMSIVGAPSGNMPDDEAMRRLSANEVACYRWPDDTNEHKALRAAFMDGAVSAAPTTSPEPAFDLAAFQKEAATWETVESEATCKDSLQVQSAPEPHPDDDPAEVAFREQEAADNLRLIDWISDKIGLPETEELTRENFSAWLASPEPDAVREMVAQIINPDAFKGWQSQYECSEKSNGAEFAQRCADYFYKEHKDAALEKADAILAALSAPVAGAWQEVVRDVLAAPHVQERLRTLDRGIGTKTSEAVWLRLRDLLPRNERGSEAR